MKFLTGSTYRNLHGFARFPDNEVIAKTVVYPHFDSQCRITSAVHSTTCILRVCLLIALDEFLQSYDNKLGNKKDDYTTAQKETVLLSVVKLLRRHSSNNRLCCENKANDLEVTDVDRYGFVTYVRCKKCQQTLDTACYDGKRTYERICNRQDLKPGDHVCWHRPYFIWHHAIVTASGSMEPAQEAIHYGGQHRVDEGLLSEIDAFCSDDCRKCNEVCGSNGSCNGFNAFYRVNYEDCYDADYTILRAQKLVGEKMYDLVKRNCEHFSRWCKTGTAKSNQVGIVLAVVNKFVVTVGIRFFALIILFGFLSLHEYLEQDLLTPKTKFERCYNSSTTNFPQCWRSREAQKDQFQRSWNCTRELLIEYRTVLEESGKWLDSLYIAITAVAFMIYLLVTSIRRLSIHPARMKRDVRDAENPCSCSELSVQCDPCTWCRRPCSLVCGRFWHIFCTESLSATGAILIVVHEHQITDNTPIRCLHPVLRAFILLLIAIGVQLVGYGLGILVARGAEGICECRAPPPDQSTADSGSQSTHVM